MSIRIIRTTVDRGINFMDNCWDYNDGRSEIRIGKALGDGYRDRVFLAKHRPLCAELRGTFVAI